MKFSAKLMTLMTAVFLSSGAWAYYDVLDTGEVMQDGKYKVTGDTQLVTSTGGLNVGGIFDMGFQEQYGLRGIVGFGTTDYDVGAMFKWMPIPDTENQPAVGMNVGLVYAKWGDARELTIRWEPLVSKKFNLERVVLTPYASVPVGIRSDTYDNGNSSQTDITFQAVVGTQLQIEKWKNIQFIGEVGVDLGNALSHITVGALWYFDNNGFEVK